MGKRWLRWLLVAVGIVVGASAWFWYDYNNKPAKEHIHDQVCTLAGKHPELQSMYDDAMQDGKLTLREAKSITDRAVTLKQGN